MNIEKLREEIAADEGEVHEIYLDHLGQTLTICQKKLNGS